LFLFDFLLLCFTIAFFPISTIQAFTAAPRASSSGSGFGGGGGGGGFSGGGFGGGGGGAF